MEHARNAEAATSTQECCAPAAKGGWLGSRKLMIGAALAAGAGALVLGWDWLVAVGVASVIVALAPCLVMCALGLCMNRMNKSEHKTAAQIPPGTPGANLQVVEAEPAAVETAAQVLNAAPVPGSTAESSGSRT